MLKKLAAVFALMLLVSGVQAATLVYSAEFEGPAGDTPTPGLQGWANPNYSGSGTAYCRNEVSASDAALKPINQTHTYEWSLRFPLLLADWSNFQDNVVIGDPVVSVQGGGNYRFEVNCGTWGDGLKLYWPQDEAASGARESNIYINQYFTQTMMTNFQNVKFVIGPSLQAIYVNGSLVHFTRYNYSALSQNIQMKFKSGGSTDRVEYDYVRVWQGDASGDPVPANLIWRDTYNQASPCKNSDFRNNAEFWGNEGVQIPIGDGRVKLNSGSSNIRRNVQRNSGGSPFALTTTWGQDITCEWYVKWADGRVSAGEAWEVIFGMGEGDNFEGTERILFRENCSGTRPNLKVLTKANNSGEDYSADIMQYMTNPETQWQKISAVYTAPSQARVFVNDGLVLTVNKTWNPAMPMTQGMKGSGAGANFIPPSLNEMSIYEGYQVPVELSAFDAE